MTRIELITFDLDGTLIDSAREIAEAANRTLQDFGLPGLSFEAITAMIGLGTRELMKDVWKASGENLSPTQLDEQVLPRFERHYNDTTGTDSQLYPGCLHGLQRLKEAGVRLACVTNKEYRFAERVLAVSGLTPFFSLLIGGDSLADKKPNPLVIDHCLQAFAVSQRAAAHVGDSSIDVATAKRAGVKAWAVPYGYNRGQAIETASPDRIFSDINAIADWVLTAA